MKGGRVSVLVLGVDLVCSYTKESPLLPETQHTGAGTWSLRGRWLRGLRHKPTQVWNNAAVVAVAQVRSCMSRKVRTGVSSHMVTFTGSSFFVKFISGRHTENDGNQRVIHLAHFVNQFSPNYIPDESLLEGINSIEEGAFLSFSPSVFICGLL